MDQNNKSKKDEHQDKSTIGLTVAAGVVGAAVGAAAVALSNKDTRDQINETLNTLKKKGTQLAEDAQDKLKEGKEKLEEEKEKLEKGKEKLAAKMPHK